MGTRRRKAPAPIGQGRHQMSLGSNDPGPARNAAAAQQTNMNLDKTLIRDERGRIGVNPSGAVKNLASDSTLENVAAKINELLQSQRDSGQMKGGR